MARCTATTLIAPPGPLAPLLEDARPASVRCELGAGHHGDHAQMLWDDDANEAAVWARWDERRSRLLPLRWCPVPDGAGEACGLFANHPPGHEWEIDESPQPPAGEPARGEGR
ncbi:hypothetical protein [Streptomyces nitrosporeus]|uniref:hypothetical protein n=1 Tax=Streptomyces nitrosporeus TaxID=28894 RepID=UPI0039A2AF40